MAVSREYLGFVLDQLNSIVNLSHRRMFGGVGLYGEGVFFAILHRDRLYFKVDDATRGLFERRGMKAFAPSSDRILRTYYEVPVDVLEDDAELCRWASRAMESQSRPQSAPRRPKTPNTGRNTA